MDITFTITSNNSSNYVEPQYDDVNLQDRSSVPNFSITTNNNPWHGNLFSSGTPHKNQIT